MTARAAASQVVMAGVLACAMSFSVCLPLSAQNRNNAWQQQQNYQRQQDQIRQQQIQQQQEQQRQQMREQMRRQQREQMRTQQRQQMQEQQRQQMQMQQRQQMQTQQRQQLQKQQAGQKQLQQQTSKQRQQLQQQGKIGADGKPTGIIVSGGVAKMARPLTPGEIQRGFTGRVTSDGKALIRYQNRIFLVPASRVAGLSARLARQQADRRAAKWTEQQKASIHQRIAALAASSGDNQRRTTSISSDTRARLLSSTSAAAVSARLEAAQIERMQNRGFTDDSVGAMRNPVVEPPPKNRAKSSYENPNSKRETKVGTSEITGKEGSGFGPRTTSGVKLDSRLPDPKAGLNYEPKILKSSNPNITNSHVNGYIAELRLANTIASLPNQVVVRYGDEIGAHGADIVSVDTKTGKVTLWDSKFRSSVRLIPQSKTFSESSRMEKAIAQAEKAIDVSNLSPSVRDQALKNLERRNFITRTTGAGEVRNSVQVIYCENKPC